MTEESSPPTAPEPEKPRRGPQRPALRSDARQRIDAFGAELVDQVRARRGNVNTDFGRLRLFPTLLDVVREHVQREFSVLPDSLITGFALEQAIIDALAQTKHARFSELFEKHIPLAIQWLRQHGPFIDEGANEALEIPRAAWPKMAALVEAAESLPIDERRVAYLWLREGKPAWDIIAILGIPLSKVNEIVRKIETTAKARAATWPTDYTGGSPPGRKPRRKS